MTSAAHDVVDVELSEAQSNANQRERLLRKLDSVCVPASTNELEALEQILMRADPSRVQGDARPQNNAPFPVTLTKASGVGRNDGTLRNLTYQYFVGHKADGIDVFAAWVCVVGGKAKNASVAPVGNPNRMLIVRRDGRVNAINDVPLPLRMGGRVLLHGELCLRKERLSPPEQRRYAGRIPNVIEFSPLDRDDGNPANDGDYKLCLAAFDCCVFDNPAKSVERGRGDAVAALPTVDRLQVVQNLLECLPEGNAKGEEAINAVVAEFEKANKVPAVRCFFKRPIPAVCFRSAIHTIPHCLRGIPLDGLIFTPDAPFTMANTPIMKYKGHNTVDFVVTKNEGSGYKFWVTKERKYIMASDQIYYGESEDEVEETLDTFRRAFVRTVGQIDNDASKKQQVVLECIPYTRELSNPAFVAFRESNPPLVDLLAHAAKLIKWRPMGVLRHEKPMPNGEKNYWNIINAIVNFVSIEEIEERIKQSMPHVAPNDMHLSPAMPAAAMALDGDQ